MNRTRKHIKQKFPDELRLLIYLSQDSIESNPFDGNLTNIDWEEFLNLVIKHRLTSHVLKHAKFLAEHIPIPTYEKLMEIRLDRSKISLNFAIHAIRIYQKFEEFNIKHCFFKGPLLSLELYQDVGFRNFRDIDVLVEQQDVEKAKLIIEDLGFDCIYPNFKLSTKQQKANYSISHHYHFKHPAQITQVELHWNITNPKSFYGVETKDIIENCRKIKISNYNLPYISKIDNLVYQAAHGSIHQWYRLFWLKDFSVILANSSAEYLDKAYEKSKQLKLGRSFKQACYLSGLLFNSDLTILNHQNIKSRLIKTALHSIRTTDLNQKGISGKLKLVLYRLRIKPTFKYHFDLLYRLRTHLTDWEIIRLNDRLFFLYYLLRPFLLIYKFVFKKRN